MNEKALPDPEAVPAIIRSPIEDDSHPRVGSEQPPELGMDGVFVPGHDDEPAQTELAPAPCLPWWRRRRGEVAGRCRNFSSQQRDVSSRQSSGDRAATESSSQSGFKRM